MESKELAVVVEGFKEVILYAHEIMGIKPKPIKVTWAIVSMYLELIKNAQANQGKESTGEKTFINLDMSKFVN